MVKISAFYEKYILIKIMFCDLKCFTAVKQIYIVKIYMQFKKKNWIYDNYKSNWYYACL